MANAAVVSPMITAEKLKIYSGYKGDVDMFSLAGKAWEKQAIKDSDWYLIDTLLQDALVVDRKLGSPQRTAQAITRLEENCEDDAVIKQVYDLARKLSRPRRRFLFWTW